jgi:hypothetical protein
MGLQGEQIRSTLVADLLDIQHLLSLLRRM